MSETLDRSIKRLSLDDIIDRISEMANDPAAGADKFRALKMLAGMQTAAAAIPEPLHDLDVVHHLARVMHPAGKHLCKLAFREAFDHTHGQKEDVSDPVQNIRRTDVKVPSVFLANNLKKLYRMYPEMLKRYPDGRPMGGTPAGYPQGKSEAAKRAWCNEQSARCYIERQQRKLDVPAATEETPIAPEVPPENREAETDPQ